MTTLHTLRLTLRPWQDSDYAAFAALNADPRVMEYFPACLTTRESNAMAERMQRAIETDGWGFWAVERRGDARFSRAGGFVGFVGLCAQPSNLPFSPCVEIGWRLSADAWGQGYATEAARRSLQFGFDDLGLTQIVAFTARGNLRSQRVMQKLGMHTCAEDDFLHPLIAPEHPLAWHVLYRLGCESNTRFLED